MMLLLILVIMWILFSFLPKLNSHHLYVHVTFGTVTEVELPCNCYSAKNMLKLLAFKWLLNELLLETMIRDHVNLMICLN